MLMQPGQTIDPKSGGDLPPEPSEDLPLPEPKEPEQPDDPRQPHEPDAPETNWNYQTPPASAGMAPAQQPQEPSAGLVQWTASEYIEHEKRASWFIILSVGAFLASALLYIFTQDAITSAVILIAAVLFGVTAARKPRTLQYELSSSGVRIENKYYPYDDFKSFSVIEEGAFNSVQLTPLKRFLPPLSLYYPPESEDKVLNALADYLPHEDRGHDAIDRLMRRVRF